MAIEKCCCLFMLLFVFINGTKIPKLAENDFLSELWERKTNFLEEIMKKAKMEIKKEMPKKEEEKADDEQEQFGRIGEGNLLERKIMAKKGEKGEKREEKEVKREEKGEKREEKEVKREEKGEKREEKGEKREEKGEKREEKEVKREEKGEKREEKEVKREEKGEKREEKGQKREEWMRGEKSNYHGGDNKPIKKEEISVNEVIIKKEVKEEEDKSIDQKAETTKEEVGGRGGEKGGRGGEGSQKDETEKWEKIVNKFEKIKAKLIHKMGSKAKSVARNHIENEIATKLGTTRRLIYKWKTKFGQTKKRNNYSDKEKSEIVQKFYKLKKIYSKKYEKEMLKPKIIDQKMSKKLGVSLRSIFNWKKQFGRKCKVPEKKRFSDSEKRKIVRNYLEKKAKNWTKIGDKTWIEKNEEIAAGFGVSWTTITKWKCHLGISAVHSEDQSTESSSSSAEEEEEEKDEKMDETSNDTDNLEHEKWHKLAEENEDNDNSSSSEEMEKRQNFPKTKNEWEKVVRKFDELKEKLIRKRSKLCNRLEMENKIAKKLGTNRRIIYKLKSAGNDNKKKIYYTEKEKHQIIKEFYKLKEQKVRENGGFGKREAEQKVARQMGINRKLIYRWKNELGIGQNEKQKKYSDDEKRKIVREFYEIRNKKKIKLGKTKEIEDEIASQLGAHRVTIRRWKKQLDMD